jgi:putative ABC transport system ATP-binding protein
MSSAIRLRGVTKTYRAGQVSVHALATVDLDIEGGELVVILGPSGSGKTTLLNIIGALDSPSEGSVSVGGRELTEASRNDLFSFRRETVSFIFQGFNLFPGLTAEENVQFAIDATGRRGRTSAASYLERVGLAERASHFPSELSGGEQQRVAIARALATGNPVLLADEPTGELDFETGRQILVLLEELAREGTTVLIVTHNREIARVANRVVQLSSGRVVSDAPPEGGQVAAAALRW